MELAVLVKMTSKNHPARTRKRMAGESRPRLLYCIVWTISIQVSAFQLKMMHSSPRQSTEWENKRTEE